VHVTPLDNVDLGSIPLFAELAPADRANAETVARGLDWDAGHVVVKDGEFAFDFYAIKRGSVEVRQGGQGIAVLGAGDFFGELGVVPYDPDHWSRRRTASVVVTAPTEAVAIAGADMRRLAEDVPQLADALRIAAAARSQPESS
jgi:CRP-like cAMP-binding protein